jgi:ketosteroid isomerase-like protein
MTSLILPVLIAAAPVPHADLLTVADAFDRAQLTKDAAALDRMVADGLVFIQGDGSRAGKREFIAGWTGPDEHYDPITLVDRMIVPLGLDAFMVSARAVLSGRSGGQRFSSAFRFTDTFRRVGDRWQAVHIQVTRISAGTSAPQ